MNSKERGEQLIVNLAKLPAWCYCHHPDDGRPIIIKKGEDGFHEPSVPDPNVEEINGLIGVTAEQEEAMLNGSILGFHAPGADPDYWIGRPLLHAKRPSPGLVTN